MKRKLTSILLLSALLTAGTSTFISCKDYDSDAIADIQGQVGDLNSVIATQITTIKEATERLDVIGDSLYKEVNNRDEQYAELIGLIEDAQSDASQALADAATAQGDIASLESRIAALEGATGGMNEEQVTELINEIVSAQYATTDQLNSVVSQLETVANYGSQITELQGATTTITNQLTSLSNDLTSAQEKWATELAEVENLANKALTLAEADSIRLDKIDKQIDSLKNATNANSESINNILTEIKSLTTTTENLTTDIEDLEVFVYDSIYTKDEVDAKLSSLYSSLSDIINTNKAEAEAYHKQVDSLIEVARLSAIESSNKYAKNYADSLYDLTNADVEALKAEVTSLKTKNEGYDAAIDSLKTRVTALETNVTSLVSRMSNVEGQLSLVNKQYARLVTGINIDKVSNPIFGSLNLPLGVKSTILCAFYGTLSDDVDGTFPTTDPSNYVYSAEASGWSLVSSATTQPVYQTKSTGLITDGYAGKLLLTVNPGDVDFTNLKMRLTSRGDDGYAPAYEKEFTLAKSTENITTRTVDASSNGAYEATITTSKNIDSLKAAQLDINESELVQDAKAILNKLRNSSTTTINVLDIAQDIYSNFVSAIPQYYAVKCEWNDSLKTRSVRSDYEIAALTMKPLSFNTASSGNSYTLPDIPTISDLGFEIEFNYSPIDTTSIEDMWVTIPDAENIKIDLKEGETAGTVTVEIEDGASEASGTITINFDALKVEAGETKIRVSLSEMRRVVAEINDQVEDLIDGVTDQFEDIISQINSTYISKINSYINRVNSLTNRLEKYIQEPNRLLRPVMFYQSNGAYGRLSRVKEVPSVFNVSDGSSKGSLALIPTTYTAELLAPAYKKWVQVKTIKGSGTATISNGTTSSDGVLLNSKERGIVLTGDAGSTYEVVYSAIDYYGYVVARTYYIQIK